MRGRCWRMLIGMVIVAASGCRTLGLTNPNHIAPTAMLVPIADGEAEPPAPELPPKDAARACIACAEELEKHASEVEAIAFYERARLRDPKCHVSGRLAVLYDRQGDFQKAQEEYRKALKESPRDADLLNDMGYGYYSRGRWAEAEKYLRQALAVKPDHAHALINLGLCVGEQGHYQEALDLFNKVLTPAQALCNLGFILTTKHKWDEAKRAYQEALENDPDIPLARAALAKLEKAEQQTPSPVQLAQATVKSDGHIANVRAPLAKAEGQSGIRQAAYWIPPPPSLSSQ
jgi:Tfp pilus assembly protein PilF